MFKGKLTIFLAILLIADAAIDPAVYPIEPALDLPAGAVSLIADNGQAIKRCKNCGIVRRPKDYPDSASVSPY